MGKLEGMRTYVSGYIDSDPESGMSWRKEITPRLQAFGVGVFDPYTKPSQYIEGKELHEVLDILLEEEKYDEVKSILKGVAGADFRMVHESSFLVLYIDKTKFTFGTPMEAAWAIQQRKPVLTVIKQGKKYVPRFLLALIPHQHIFSSFDEMFSYLERVDKGLEPDLRRWHFFDYKKLYGEPNI